MIYLHGESEYTGVAIIRGEYEDPFKDHDVWRIRNEHDMGEHFRNRPITILEFGVDHGLGAHAGNGDDWRSTVIAHVRYDYLKSKPSGYIRISKSNALELLEELAKAIAISHR